MMSLSHEKQTYFYYRVMRIGQLEEAVLHTLQHRRRGHSNLRRRHRSWARRFAKLQ